MKTGGGAMSQINSYFPTRAWAGRSALALVAIVAATGCGEQRGADSNKSQKPTEPATGPRESAAAPADAAPAPGRHRAREFATPAKALAAILEEKKPRVIGFGEYHELRSSAAVQSTIHRFTADMIDLLAGRATDLVVETWVEVGRCGEEEKRVSKDVRQVTERPKHTQNELVIMIQRAKKLAIRPHLLELRCADYKAVLKQGLAPGSPELERSSQPPSSEEVDYEKLLQLVAAKLRDNAIAGLELRGDQGVIALYGGSLHNDLYPVPGTEDFSYAPAVDRAAKGGYVEVDLYVPEYIDADPDLKSEPWYPSYRQRAGADRVLLFERAPRSYILILRRGLMRSAPPALPAKPANP